MLRLFTALAAAIVAGLLLAGSTTGASAKCGRCGPLAPTIHVHLVHPSSAYTRYHDRSVYRHVPREHRIVTITRIQPIVRIHDVTRIHHHTVYYVQDTYARQTVHLAPLTYMRSSVVNTYDGGCGCGY